MKTIIINETTVEVDGVKYTREAEWPSKGDRYYYIEANGYVGNDIWEVDSSPVDDSRRNYTGIFKTEAEAQKKAAKVKALCGPVKLVPNNGNMYYWAIDRAGHEGEAGYSVWKSDTVDMWRLSIGNVHQTEQSAKDWYKAVMGE